MQDRVSLYPNRVILTPVSGQTNTYDLQRADQPQIEGTPLNKATLLSDSTATALGLNATTGTPDEAFSHLQEELDNKVKKTTATLNGSNWQEQSDFVYTQTVTVQGVTASNDVLVAPQTAYQELYEKISCKAVSQATNSITFRCTDPQDENIVVDVIIFNL